MQELRTITLNFPLYDSHASGEERLRKVHEELAEVAWESADAKKINIQQLILEAQDVLQASISLAYHGLAKAMEHDKAIAVLEVLIGALNDSHCAKIGRYAKERRWTAL